MSHFTLFARLGESMGSLGITLRKAMLARVNPKNIKEEFETKIGIVIADLNLVIDSCELSKTSVERVATRRKADYEKKQGRV